MKRVKELRRKANLYRRAAGQRTEGGSAADRILVELAEQLERKADDRLVWLRDVPKTPPSD